MAFKPAWKCESCRKITWSHDCPTSCTCEIAAQDFISFIDYVGCPHLHTAFEGLRYCSHTSNPESCEGNCNINDCPLKDAYIKGMIELNSFDPMNQQDEEEY